VSERRRLVAKSTDPDDADMPWAVNFYAGTVWIGAVYCKTWLEAIACAFQDAQWEANR
jgi:hypothetical protein